MYPMGCRNVLSLFSLRSNEKRSGGSSKVLVGILYKYQTGCRWAMLPVCYVSKKLSTSISSLMAEICHILF